MAHYRLYFLERDKISKATDLDCESDEDAINKVAALRSAQVIELWQGTRLIKRIEPFSAVGQ